MGKKSVGSDLGHIKVEVDHDRPFFWPARAAALQTLQLLMRLPECIDWMNCFMPSTDSTTDSADKNREREKEKEKEREREKQRDSSRSSVTGTSSSAHSVSVLAHSTVITNTNNTGNTGNTGNASNASKSASVSNVNSASNNEVDERPPPRRRRSGSGGGGETSETTTSSSSSSASNNNNNNNNNKASSTQSQKHQVLLRLAWDPRCRAAALDVLYNLLHSCAQCVYLDSVAVRDLSSASLNRSVSGSGGPNSGPNSIDQHNSYSLYRGKGPTSTSIDASDAASTSSYSFFAMTNSPSRASNQQLRRSGSVFEYGGSGNSIDKDNKDSKDNKDNTEMQMYAAAEDASTLSAHELLAHEVAKGLLQIVQLSVKVRLHDANADTSTKDTEKCGAESSKSKSESADKSESIDECWHSLSDSYKGCFPVQFLSSPIHENDGFGAAVGALQTLVMLCR